MMRKNVQARKYITTTDAQQYELLSPMLDALLGEVKDLSKKKQDEPLNRLKVQMINKVLEQIKDLIANEPTIQFVNLLDDETLPTNSDAVLILTQFRTAMDIFHDKYYCWDGSDWVWLTK